MDRMSEWFIDRDLRMKWEMLWVERRLADWGASETNCGETSGADSLLREINEGCENLQDNDQRKCFNRGGKRTGSGQDYGGGNKSHQ
jgi:hypothetical protein